LFGRGQDSILSFIFFLQTQQTITRAFFWPMEELARGRRYVHEDRPEMSEHLYFIKRENGFDYGLIIDKNGKKRIEPRLFTTRNTGANMFYIGMGVVKRFDYADERELRQHLEEILRVFQQAGDP
jgi:hypothetical protein